VEVALDLGFHPDAAGFQSEGLVVDESGRPVQGIHPRRTKLRVAADPGPVTIRLEAASNPTFVQFAPSQLGSPDTAGDRPLYRLRRAELLLIDSDAEALAHDIDVLAGLLEAFADDDPRGDRFRLVIAKALDRLPDVAGMRSVLRPLLHTRAADSAHRVVATGHAHIDTA
jgi:alpha-mannosidase